MTSLGMMLLVASATTGLGKPHVGGMMFHRHGVVADGPPPPGGPLQPGAGGPGGPGMMDPNANRRFANVKSQVVFFGPGGPSGAGDMKISWQSGAGPTGDRIYLPGRSTPFRYNFMQGYVYRLRLSDISGRPTLNLYPTIEVAPSTPATDAYLTHNQIPVQFTAEDLDQVEGGNFVTKVIYLPDPRYQELAVANVETLVSTRLEPGVDPILEADKRGTILMVVRIGGIDLEMEGSGAVTIPSDTAPAPVPGVTTMPPGAFPATVIPSAPINSVPLEAPATPAPAGVVPAPAEPATPPPAPEPAPAPPVPAPAPPSPELPGL